MTPPRPNVDLEALLRHAGWLRALARRLVRDADLAEDLTQDTWVAALEHPPTTDQPVRGWLATVLRHKLSSSRRGTRRRIAREEGAARAEAVDDGAELLEKVATQRDLTEAVLGLEEPYRTAILLRYFEELSPKRIAARQGVPVSTVKTRLARGLEKLRGRLDRGHGGDGRAWLLALLPVAREPLGAAPRLSLTPDGTGALVVNAKLVLSAVLVTAVGATLVTVVRRGAPATSEAPRPEVAAAAPAEVEPLATPTEPGEVRVAVLEPGGEDDRPAAAARATEPADEGPLRVVRGRVIDVASRPVPGVEVSWSADGEDGVATGPDGAFEVAVRGGGRLSVVDERWTTVLFGTAVDPERGESVLVVAPRASAVGTVVDEDGVPVPGARVRLVLPEDFRGRLTTVLDNSEDGSWGTRAAEDGTFRLADLPAVPEATLEAVEEGYARAEQPAPLGPRGGLVLVLGRPEPGADRIEGVVVDGAGAPVPEARVSWGIDATETDGEGRFVFDLADPVSFNRQIQGFILDYSPDALTALKRGYLPARLEPHRDAEGNARWPQPLVLRLGGEPLSLEGRVVDADGAPRSGARVWVADPTFFGGLGEPGGDRGPRMMHAETLLAGGAETWHRVETDDDGRFAIEGLLEREYALQAMDPDTLLRVEVPGVRAGKRNVEIVLDDAGLWPTLAGHVVDVRGEPLEGISVFPMCDSFRIKLGERVVGTHHSGAGTVRTDAEGRFELRSVPRDLVYLRLNGEDTIPLEWGRHVEGGLAKLVDSPEDVVITLERRCHFQVELRRPDEADELGVRDVRGDEMEISEFAGSTRREGMRQPIRGGLSSTLGVGDSAAELVLYKQGREVRRVPLRLTPGERATLTP